MIEDASNIDPANAESVQVDACRDYFAEESDSFRIGDMSIKQDVSISIEPEMTSSPTPDLLPESKSSSAHAPNSPALLEPSLSSMPASSASLSSLDSSLELNSSPTPVPNTSFTSRENGKGFRTAISKHIYRLTNEYMGDVLIALSIATITLLILTLLGRDWEEALDNRGGAIKSVSQIITTAIAAVATLAGYRRFFRGRMFASRLRLTVSSKRVCAIGRLASEGSDVLHVVDVEIANIGSVIVWEPEVEIHIREIGSDNSISDAIPADGFTVELKRGGSPGIAPGETIVRHYHVTMCGRILAFRVCVDLHTSRRDAWHRTITVPNIQDETDA